MKTTWKLTLAVVALLMCVAIVQAEYQKTTEPNGLIIYLRNDYGLDDEDGQSNQSETFQAAINNIAAAGEGRLIPGQVIKQTAF